MPLKQGVFIKACAIMNAWVWGVMVVQYIIYLISSNALLIAVLGEIIMMCGGMLLSWLAMKLSEYNTYLSRIVASVLQIALFSVYAFLSFFINGPFVIPLLVVETSLAVLNSIAFLDQIIGVREAFRNRGTMKSRSRFPSKRTWLVVASIVAILGVLSASLAFSTITVKVPDGSKTTSSFWGSPDLTIATVSTKVMPLDNWTLDIAPESISSPPSDYGNGSLAYVESVIEDGNPSQNHANYTTGARSYPNGTVVLSDPLPLATSNVTVTFAYVQNWHVLQMLGQTNATVILNAFGSYINEPDPFVNVRSTYMFQLFDYWKIQFYLQVNVDDDYSNAFNYMNIAPLANKTLDWSMQWQQFLGVSLDCEQEAYPQPAGNQPGSPPLFPGTLIPNEWSSWKQAWYWMNGQNETLFSRARVAYEGIFQHAMELGKKIEIVLGPSDFSEYVDGDEDYHSNPAIPFTRMPSVRYSQMSYHDNDPDGQFALYRDCVEQLRQLGTRGSSILIGWISAGARWYTPDEAGFQRYVNDCLVARAAGITEIFHAPIYNIQSGWGDDAIIRLHDALNDAGGQVITIRVVQFTNFFIWDMWKNFNKPTLFICTACMFSWIMFVLALVLRKKW